MQLQHELKCIEVRLEGFFYIRVTGSENDPTELGWGYIVHDGLAATSSACMRST